MRRREFIGGLVGTAALPFVARAQQPDRMRRIGVLRALAKDDIEGQERLAAFVQQLQQLGWRDGYNITIDTRWGSGNNENVRKHAAELLALAPDVIIANASPAVAAFQQVTRTVPVVFVGVIDPVGAGFVDNLARPGGNATGLSLFEYGISGKWLELLKEIAPGVKRAAVFRDPAIAAGIGQLAAIQSVAPSFGVELNFIGARDAAEIERAITAFVRSSNDGLIMTASPLGAGHRDLIIGLAARYKLPAVYPFRYYAASGGLVSLGPNQVKQFRPAAEYVDRILKGEKPADLPVEGPTKYELAINLKTAKALGLSIPQSLLARADEVIE